MIASLHAQEKRLRALEGIDVLFLRSGAFYESFYGSLDFIAAAGFMGDVVAPDTPVPMVASARRGSVRRAGAAKVGEFSGKVVQELLGPRDLTHAEVAEILGERHRSAWARVRRDARGRDGRHPHRRQVSRRTSRRRWWPSARH